MDRVDSFDTDFQQVHLFKISEIFTILLLNIGNLKGKKRKTIFNNNNNKKNPKIRVTMGTA